MEYSIFETEKGWAGISFSEAGLCRLVFPDPDRGLIEQELGVRGGWTEVAESSYSKELKRYFAGEKVALQFPVDWSWATPFQKEVLELVRQIPYGETETYGSIAARMGKPKAARAVGGALSRNQVPLVIPCHRVLSTGKLLGGFTSRNGISDKITLLQMEGILIVK